MREDGELASKLWLSNGGHQNNNVHVTLSLELFQIFDKMLLSI